MKSILIILFGCFLAIGELRAQDLVLADSPMAVTSFGAAVCGDYLYLYGGTEPSNNWSLETQNNIFRRLELKSGASWEELGEVPRRQANGLVSYKNKLYRLGGFEALNTADRQMRLRSSNEFLVYDPENPGWQELTAMPEPRSDFDAVVVGDTLYVVGGRSIDDWEMTNLETAWKIDLSDPHARWKPIRQPPSVRRGCSVSHYRGKIFVVGGWVPAVGGATQTTKTVVVFDPHTDSWSNGPELPGSSGQGLGQSAINVGGNLIVSTFDGRILKLSDDAEIWETIYQLDPGRHQHRLVGLDDHRFAIVGGSSDQGVQTSIPVFDLNAMPEYPPPQPESDK